MFWQIIFLISLSHAFQQSLIQTNCIEQEDCRTVRYKLNSKRHWTGAWTQTFSGRVEVNKRSDEIETQFAHSIKEVKGNRIIQMQGVTIDTGSRLYMGNRLRFDDSNPAMVRSEDGLTAQRDTDLEYPVTLFTNRPLKESESFRIWIKKICDEFESVGGVGIFTEVPTPMDIFLEIYESPHAWMYNNGVVYNEGRTVVEFNTTDTNTLKVGDIMEVIRSSPNIVEFKVNGESKGNISSNFPLLVYGVLDLRGRLCGARII